MEIFRLGIALVAIAGAGAQPLPSSDLPSPEWTKDLIIYEIATKGFTSPNGPETGTFNSLKDKLPYLAELGITGIWLTGHSLADPKHFYNIWSQYSVIEPDKIDPTLGTPEEFQAFIEEAHRRGIKVFLDVITHGVMNNSPLIQKHPRWFRAAGWGIARGMTDYDWYGGHTDLDNWWVQMWTEYVTKVGVDGFRLDVDIWRPDLWARIRENAAAAGHPIVIFEELKSAISGVSDFAQRETLVSHPETGLLHDSPILHDLPGVFESKYGKKGSYRVEIQYADGMKVNGETGGHGTLRVRFHGVAADKVSFRGEEDGPDGLPDVQLTVEKLDPARQIQEIRVTDAAGGRWELHHNRRLVLEGEPPAMRIYIATRGHGWPSIQLSCHDNGWEGYPRDQNPYAADGSRSTFGYSFLFTPMIPIFMSGEEFDANFRPIPGLSPYLYGGKEARKGTWLYTAPCSIGIASSNLVIRPC